VSTRRARTLELAYYKPGCGGRQRQIASAYRVVVWGPCAGKYTVLSGLRALVNGGCGLIERTYYPGGSWAVNNSRETTNTSAWNVPQVIDGLLVRASFDDSEVLCRRCTGGARRLVDGTAAAQSGIVFTPSSSHARSGPLGLPSN